MSKFAVFIATTGGPIHVERLTEEQAPQSLMCVRRSSTILEVSGDYDDFVKLGSGVIEREFGPFEGNSFRADVSEPIETGTSWQLPMFLAHTIHFCDGVSLTDRIEEADYILWATGHVDYDLNVTSVEHISQKISGAKSFIQSLRQDPQKIILTAPNGRNFDQLNATPEFSQFRNVACNNALDLVTELQLPVKSRTVSVSNNKPTKTKSHNRYSPLWPALVLILGVIALASFSDQTRWADFWSTVTKNKQIITGSQNNVKIDSIAQKVTANRFITEIAALRPLPGSNCAQIAFSGRKAQREVLQPDNNGQLPESRLSETCGLSFSINNGKSERFTALHIEVVSGYHLKPDNRPLYLGGNVKFSGKQTWQIRLPRQLDEHYSYKVTTLSSKAPVGGFISKLSKIGANHPHTALPESVTHSTLYHKVTH